MIFVTVGTHGQAFGRLLRALGPLAEMDELIVQHGDGPAPAEAALAVPFLSAGDTLRHVERARAVVTHGGVGSFLVAWRLGHIPVVVPRLRSHGEHVDDHQVEFVRELDHHGYVIAVWDVAELAAKVREVPPRQAPRQTVPTTLETSVRRALNGQPVELPWRAPG